MRTRLCPLLARPTSSRQEVDNMAQRSALIAMLIAAPLLLLGGCSAPRDPAYGANAPRNGFGQPVDPVYGTQLPGTTRAAAGATDLSASSHDDRPRERPAPLIRHRCRPRALAVAGGIVISCLTNDTTLHERLV